MRGPGTARRTGIDGSGTAAGNYWIPGVPPGGYWLKISDGADSSYGWLDASRNDIFGESMGRPNSVEATVSTPVTLNLTASRNK